MLPVIALVGRPNVGKSTLFNRLTKSRDALVANFEGLTRDRKYGEATYDGRRLLLIDTGGITGEEVGIDEEMAKQSLAAVEEADVVFFLVDARAGLTGVDEVLARHLRTSNKKTYLLVNKVDGVNIDIALADFYALGLEKVCPITASQGHGVRSLMEEVLSGLPVEEEDEELDAARGIKIGIVGRPNVGKSTLVNRMLGEERVIVYDMPGTTRDSIYIDYQRDGKDYTIIDTAGVRRRKNVRETVEKFSIVKTLQAIDDANVVVLLMDAHEGIVDQDLHIMGYVLDSGRALVIGVNKWDGMTADERESVRSELDRRLTFIDFAEIHFISALHGTGVGHLYESVEKAYTSATRRLVTNELTQVLEGAVFDHQPPMINGRRIKLRYAHAGGHNPPVIVVHGNQTGKVPASYKRYLEKVFRRELGLVGTPIRMEFKSSENPYTAKEASVEEGEKKKQKRLTTQTKKEKGKRQQQRKRQTRGPKKSG
ncbi:GTP-binding protein [Sinobacterium caligoides]|uniref:GTPase Der n=1 Tax=Sinobacterium caligoides TaxID=933926 RepID=A0A3N2DZ68_9GAMM|nr:ribosome biogenesis GTPase Der [Sinobacterium caligoides]ROS05163.1 GTP-binding protein [Sinobacterium caligoides]